MPDSASPAPATDAYSKANPSKFTFKSKSERRTKRSSRQHDDDNDDNEPSRSPKRPRSEKDTKSRHRHRHKSKRRHGSSHDDRHPTSTLDGTYYDPSHRHRESLYDDLESTRDPDAAFRESLFDALADDEGAAYWEGVYGQPVHVYSDTKPGADGTLERMTEDEYAEYVRSKMWEKSHQHLVEERAAREQARREKQKQKQARRLDYDDDDMAREEHERENVRRRVAESLARGEERKRAKEAQAAWENYTRKWHVLKDHPPVSAEKIADAIPWPVLSGNMQHVSSDHVERFLQSSPLWKDDAAGLLKAERVRWHPDKLQQRFGRLVDGHVIKVVTAVFQIIDRLWHQRR